MHPTNHHSATCRQPGGLKLYTHAAQTSWKALEENCFVTEGLSSMSISFTLHILYYNIMKKISQQCHKEIIQKLKDGLSHRKIAQQYNVAIGTVSNVRKTLLAVLPKSKMGRLKKMQFHHHHFLEREFKSRTIKTVQQACQVFKERFNTNISHTTMHKELIKQHYKARVIIKRPLLTKKHRKACLLFAQTYKDWTVDDWKSIIWSDEIKINCMGSDGHCFCWLKASGLASSLIQPTLKYGSGSIMVWGCMTRAGAGKMTVIHGFMDSTIYVNILKENLVPTMDEL